MLKKTIFAAALVCGMSAHADDLQDFRSLYKELVETNTQGSNGSCTLAAERMAARLKAAGYADQDLVLFADPAVPQDGGLVAALQGTDAKQKAILLLAHIDAVEAKREDWRTDPYTLVEQDGKFFGRATADDKSMAAIFTDSLIRLKKEGYKPKRTIKMALTCGEEGGSHVNGARWLVQNKRDLIDAAFAINEGGRIQLDEQGKPQEMDLYSGEKTPHNYKLEVTNPGGHSSLPVPNNAIYHLAHALAAVESHPFPPQLIDINKAYFSGLAKIEEAQGHHDVAQAMIAMVKDPSDVKDAEFVAAQNPLWNSTMRTTCVATMLSGGHANNALPQRAEATINCRIFPTSSGEAVRAALEAAINDPEVKLTMVGGERMTPLPPKMDEVSAPVVTLAAEMWPGVPVLPFILTGGTDGSTITAAGIPTFGVDGLARDRRTNNFAHGTNEYAGVQELYKDREFLFRIIKLYAPQ